MRRLLLSALLCLIALPAVTDAQEVPVLTARARLEARGLVIDLRIPPRTYAYLASTYAITLAVTVDPAPGAAFAAPRWPQGSRNKDGDTILSGDTTVVLPWGAVPPALAGQAVTVGAGLRYQLCDAAKGVCYPPRTVRLTAAGSLPTAVDGKKTATTGDPTGKTGAPADKTKAPAANAGKPADTAAAGSSDGVRDLLARNLGNPLLAFLVAILGGFLASLTPCVYPVIPITVGYFAKRAGEGAGAGARLSSALVYVAGMSVVYTALGVVAGLTGGLFGALTNSPFFFVGLGLLFFLLALSLFDVWELKLPGRLAGAGGGSGLGGPFLMGMATGLVASPCVGPIVFFLLTGVFQAGQPLYGALLMFGFSLGMGVLFLVLGLLGQKAARLPRSGNWMVRVKLVLGGLVLASALYFAALAAKGLALPGWAWWTVVAAALAAALFLGARALRRLYGPGPRHATLLAVLVAGVAAWLALTAGGERHLAWENDLDRAMARARVENKAVFVDLYAEWCSVCRLLEKELIARPDLLARLERDFVTARIDYDLHKELLQSRFKVASLPWVLVLAPNGRVAWKRVGFDDAAAFVRELETLLPTLATNR